MDVQNRLVSVSTRRIVFQGALVLGLIAVVLMFFASLGRTAQTFPTTAPHVITSPEQSPDAQDRNGAYNQGLASRWNNMSPDAQERNAAYSRVLGTGTSNDSGCRPGIASRIQAGAWTQGHKAC
jgi:hypothetical protein